MFPHVPRPGHIVFDWGNTLMPDDPSRAQPMASWPQVSVYPDVLPALERLHGRVVLSVATNAEQSDEAAILAALARVDIDRFFAHIFCFRTMGMRKEQPGFWPHVLGRLGVDSSAVWMVGDSWESDIVPAVTAGLHAVWLNRRGAPPRPSAGATSVTSLEELVRRVVP